MHAKVDMLTVSMILFAVGTLATGTVQMLMS